MRKFKMFGFLNFSLLLTALACVCKADGTFEDAETSKDYASSDTYSLLELRHTIPGEPEVDYPIFSKVPKTSFKCTGRHEGYYADTETRCQVFRICAHTALSIHGFAFLCPNGTLFSQKNFVCDWYRNVNCEESEQYYSKNNANRLGSNVDTMMERVRQMMEYPIKTISKALKANNQARPKSPQPAQPAHYTHKKQLELGDGGANVSEVDAVPESSSNQQGYSTHKQFGTGSHFETGMQHAGYKTHTRTEHVGRATTINIGNRRTPTNHGEIYVNSLGELSTDPGVDFVHDTARIISEPRQGTHNANLKSFSADSSSIGLEVPSKLLVPPEYVTNVKDLQSNEEFVLASNVNNLLNDVSVDLRSNSVGAHVPSKNATSFRFLSQGFTSQSERAKQAAYEYGKPKQTASAQRFSTNELPIYENYKSEKGSVVQTGSFNLITDTNKSTTEDVDASINLTATPAPIQPAEMELESNIHKGISELNQGLSKTLEPKTTEVPVVINNAVAATNSTNYYLSTVTKEHQNSDDNVLSLPLYEVKENIESAPTNGLTLSPATTTVHSALLLSKEEVNAVLPTPAKLLLPPDTQPAPAEALTDTSNYPTIVDEDKLDAVHHAATLLLAGVKLTAHNNNGNENNEIKQPAELTLNSTKLSKNESGGFFIHVVDEDINGLYNSSEIVTEEPALSTTSAIPITTATIPTPQPEASTSVIESLSEAENFQERIRSYRRFPIQQQIAKNTLETEKGTHEQEIEETKTTATITESANSSTTTTPIPVMRSYLKRVSASRLRLSRLTATNNRVTFKNSSTAADASEDSTETSKKVSVRNIDKEVGNAGSEDAVKRTDTRGNSFHLSGSRGTKRARDNSRSGVKRERTNAERTTTVSSQRARNAAARRRNRFSNFKPSTEASNAVTSATTSATVEKPTKATTAMASTTEAPQTTTTSYTQSIPLSPESSTQTSTTPSGASNVSSNLQPTGAPEAQIKTSAVATFVDEKQSDSNFSKHISSDQTTTTPTTPPDTSELISSISAPTSSSSFTSSLTSSPTSFISGAQPNRSSIVSSDDALNAIDFTKFTQTIADNSILQNFRTTQSTVYQPVSTASSRSLSVNDYGASSSVQNIHQYNKLPTQDTSQLIPPPRPQYLPQVFNQHSPTPTSPSPRIVIAPAVGQRIAPSSFTSVISTLVTQPPPKATPSTSYVPLNDFLTKKFGQTGETKSNVNYDNKQPSEISPTTSHQQHQFYQKPNTNVFFEQQQSLYDQQQRQLQQLQYKQTQLEQLHQYQQQQQQYRQQQSPKQQLFNTHFSNLPAKQSQPSQQYGPNEIYNAPQPSTFAQTSSHKLPPQQQLFTQQPQFSQQRGHQQYAQHSQQNHNYLPPTQAKYQMQKPSSPNSFLFHQQQSAQIPTHTITPNRQQQRAFNTAPNFNIFPPLSSSAPFSTQPSTSYSIALPQGRDLHLNIKLPALTTGLIPSPTAQRRVDNLEDVDSKISDVQKDTSNRSYSGASSYDVPLNSIGRLPNDITHLLNRLRRVKK